MKVRTILGCLLSSSLLATLTVLISTPPAEAAACAPDSTAAWAECSASSDGTMIVETVKYAGPIGLVGGLVCRPVTAGPHPVLVMNHGAGKDKAIDDSTIAGSCEQRAREGWYVIASDYRPVETATSPTSDGCLGEVDDVVAMIDVARTVSFADDSRIGVRGISLGGCITLKIHQQGVPGLIAAATINGMSDVQATRNHAWSKYNQFLCYLGPILNLGCGAWEMVWRGIQQATGGAPGPATQAQYDIRSPITQADDTAASTVPLGMIQGANDQLIPPGQACAFAAAVNGQPGGTWDFTPVHYGTQSAGYPVLATAPASCPGQGTWYTGSTPFPAFPGDHYLAIVDGLDHVSPAQVLNDAELWVDAFLASKL